MIEQFVAAGAGLRDVDCWEHPFLCEGSVEAKFHVTCAFELLENDVVHPVLGFDQRGGHDGEAASLGGVPCGAEELFRFDECLGVEAAGHDTTFSWL